ncbi:unnamed protein product [Phytophthora fragariaefolia]|uniref:Unnamed protein product n=1 Tax=Phytophthora fragariaefolia TaxID=1490495 RepID=A0A9W6Y4C5_9STRA|nr:unnamed protein product [Phytophthora fragariaefolia]
MASPKHALRSGTRPFGPAGNSRQVGKALRAAPAKPEHRKALQDRLELQLRRKERSRGIGGDDGDNECRDDQASTGTLRVI